MEEIAEAIFFNGVSGFVEIKSGILRIFRDEEF